MSRCIALVPRGEFHYRCNRTATRGAYCEVHAVEILAMLPQPEPRVCECHRLCERLLAERFGEEEAVGQQPMRAIDY